MVEDVVDVVEDVELVVDVEEEETLCSCGVTGKHDSSQFLPPLLKSQMHLPINLWQSSFFMPLQFSGSASTHFTSLSAFGLNMHFMSSFKQASCVASRLWQSEPAFVVEVVVSFVEVEVVVDFVEVVVEVDEGDPPEVLGKHASSHCSFALL